MGIKVPDGIGGYTELASMKRHDGTNWIDCQFVRAYEGGSWVDKWVRIRNLVTNYAPNSAYIPNYLLATSRSNQQGLPLSNYTHATSKRGCSYKAITDAIIYMSTPLLDVSAFTKLKVTAYTVRKDATYNTDTVTIGIASAFTPGDYQSATTSIVPRATYQAYQTFQNGTVSFEFDVSAYSSIYLVGEFFFNNGVLGVGATKDFQFVNVTLE